MKTTLLLSLLALISGALIPVQAASNAALSRTIGGNVPFAALTLFLVAAAASAVVVLVQGQGLPVSKALAESPWWSFSGGPIVAFYVFTITFLSPRLGVGNAIALIVAGQVFSALTIDHFGLMRSLVFTLTPTRIAGAALVVVGVFLALRR
ncbi:MAG TPA: DMT family transporter [Gammaproteobacteria bacterium]|nr:DMT family transporter [Gammaproteobacteria bacterium]